MPTQEDAPTESYLSQLATDGHSRSVEDPADHSSYIIMGTLNYNAISNKNMQSMLKYGKRLKLTCPRPEYLGNPQ